MTDRLNGVLVVFKRDIRDDDAEHIINAIKQLRGVLDVQPNIADPSTAIATTRAKQDLIEKLWDVLK